MFLTAFATGCSTVPNAGNAISGPDGSEVPTEGAISPFRLVNSPLYCEVNTWQGHPEFERGYMFVLYDAADNLTRIAVAREGPPLMLPDRVVPVYLLLSRKGGFGSRIGPFEGVVDHDGQQVRALLDAVNFDTVMIDLIAKHDTLEVEYESEVIAGSSLANAGAAIAALKSCAQERQSSQRKR